VELLSQCRGAPCAVAFVCRYMSGSWLCVFVCILRFGAPKAWIVDPFADDGAAPRSHMTGVGGIPCGGQSRGSRGSSGDIHVMWDFKT
jgi:hypothetical protein